LSSTNLTDSFTISLHDAIPIYPGHDDREDEKRHRDEQEGRGAERLREAGRQPGAEDRPDGAAHRDHPVEPLALLQGEAVRHQRPDRKSTRLNSSHVKISYAVFC